MIDSTRLPICGPGTWLTNLHGLQRSTYRKIHLRVDPTTSLVVAGVVTSCQKHDCQVLGEVLDVAPPPPDTVVIGDGAYDRRLCYAAAKLHRTHLITPPGKLAVLHPGDDWHARNRSIEESRFLGRPNWKLGMHLTQVTKNDYFSLMTREAESQLLAFCASQREAFDSSAWACFGAVSEMELAATARYLAGVEWFGHQQTLTHVADQLTTFNFEELSQRVDFDPGRFKGMLQARLVHADNQVAL